MLSLIIASIVTSIIVIILVIYGAYGRRRVPTSTVRVNTIPVQHGTVYPTHVNVIQPSYQNATVIPANQFTTTAYAYPATYPATRSDAVVYHSANGVPTKIYTHQVPIHTNYIRH